MAFKIYTKTGDEGQTSLIGGTRIHKSHIRIEAYGTVDELNSHLGLVADLAQIENVTSQLKEIQDRLFTIGSALATDPDKDIKMRLPDLHEEDIAFLEQQIDAMDEQLKPLKSFILPGGHQAASAAHIARCVCRRVERICVGMQDDNQFVPPLVIPYINRLSDYLFTLARFIAHHYKAIEVEWKPRM